MFSNLFKTLGVSKMSNSQFFSAVPNSFVALTVIIPKWVEVTFGIINEYLSLETSFSIRTPSLLVNSFPLNNQITFGFGFDFTTHSNLTSLSFKTFWSVGSSSNTGPQLTFKVALFDTTSPREFTILTINEDPVSLDFTFISFKVDEDAVFDISTFSFWISSSVSFLNHLMLVGSGFETNLQTNSAACPSFIETFSTLAVIFGKSFFC